MKLKLKNVGKINNANIKIDGITIIAGENNSGKSTIGKMLYSIYNSFCKIEEKIENERKNSIVRTIQYFYMSKMSHYDTVSQIYNTVDRIVSNRNGYINDKEKITEEISNYLNRNSIKYEEEELTDLTNKIMDFLKVDDSEFRNIILKKNLDNEFAMNVVNLNNMNKAAEIEAEIKDKKIKFEVIKNKDINILNYISLIKDAVYIENPFILDRINDYIFSNNRYSRAYNMEQKIRKINNNNFGVLDEIVAYKKMENIFDVINQVCDGTLEKNEGGNIVYKTSKLKGTLDISNLSTGIKSFVILKTLLLNGAIEENGIIILDEPEIHLHPAWQVIFAEIIVLIQKEFKTNIILTTHSPYFLNAIEVYSKKYKIDNICNYYLAEETNMSTDFIDVTNDTEKIYEKLAEPLQILENLEYS